MKMFISHRIVRGLCLVVTGLIWLLPGSARAASNLLTVAVFDFKAASETARDAGSRLAAVVSAQLSAQADLLTVERADLEKILGEQELGLGGTVAPGNAVRVGQLTGAQVLVTGHVFAEGQELVAVAKVMSTETSQVYGQTSRVKDLEAVSALGEALAAKIIATISQRKAMLVATAPTSEERLAALLKRLPAGKRPVVAVKIPEVHFGRQVPDPAAQTELLLILSKAGFTIVDQQSKQKPDIEITGEAFSALGMRKGNLIACKARIEVKVQDLNQKKLIGVDRQTAVAVDITEQTAGKSALQQAAQELAERILPQLL